MTMKTNHMNVLCLLIIALCYINNSETATCSPSTGPSGARQCVKLSGYTDYQWATCRTESYIRLRDGHACKNPLSTYCLYQCMLEKYSRGSGVVYSSCRCIPECNADTVGSTHCLQLSTYNYQYQWVTCYSDRYIRSSSNRKHGCTDRSRTYCYYQCMIEKYDETSGNVYSGCRCTPGEKPPTNSKNSPTNSASQNEKYTFAFVVFVAISSLFVS